MPRATSWRIAAGSVQGVSHARAGAPCQDAHDHRRIGADAVVAAVADGAGSARQAEVGARLAVRAAVEFVAAGWTGRAGAGEELLSGAFAAARAQLEREASQREVAIAELATTLIVALVTADGVAAAQIGDGACVVARADAFAAMIRPDCGEYVNETTFLTSPDWQESVRRAVSPVTTGVALMSDGLQLLALKMPHGEPHPPFFAPLFHFASAAVSDAVASAGVAEFLGSPRVAARTDDDVTLLLVGRVAG